MWLVRFHTPANWWKLMQLLGSALSHTACENANLPPSKLAGAAKYRRLTLASAVVLVFERNVSDLGKEGKKKGRCTSALLRSRAACRTWQHAVRYALTVRATDHNQEFTYGYFLRGSFDSSRSVAFAMSYTYAYYDSRYNQFGSWRGLPSVHRAIDRCRAHMIAVIVR